jgi:hypothetical protein
MILFILIWLIFCKNINLQSKIAQLHEKGSLAIEGFDQGTSSLKWDDPFENTDERLLVSDIYELPTKKWQIVLQRNSKGFCQDTMFDGIDFVNMTKIILKSIMTDKELNTSSTLSEQIIVKYIYATSSSDKETTLSAYVIRPGAAYGKHIEIKLTRKNKTYCIKSVEVIGNIPQDQLELNDYYDPYAMQWASLQPSLSLSSNTSSLSLSS